MLSQIRSGLLAHERLRSGRVEAPAIASRVVVGHRNSPFGMFGPASPRAEPSQYLASTRGCLGLAQHHGIVPPLLASRDGWGDRLALDITNVITSIVTPERISRLRSRLKLSRAALARLLGVTEMTIIRWESGEQSSPRGLQLLLLQALERARERADDETLGRLVNEATVAPGPAIQRLLTLAHPPEASTSRRTQRREK